MYNVLTEDKRKVTKDEKRMELSDKVCTFCTYLLKSFLKFGQQSITLNKHFIKLNKHFNLQLNKYFNLQLNKH